jgi:hypothetical protein
MSMRPIGLTVSLSLLLWSVAWADTDGSAVAVWKQQRLDFRYAGRASRYSCEGLRDKVRAMLIDLGARRDLRIEPLDCADLDRRKPDAGPPHLKIEFFAPALMALGRVASRPGTPARFESFTIIGDAFRNMGVGDCELVQEFVRQILPHFTVRNVTQQISCSADHPGFNRFIVQGQVLRPLATRSALIP